jgi:hypothetical protein
MICSGADVVRRCEEVCTASPRFSALFTLLTTFDCPRLQLPPTRCCLKLKPSWCVGCVGHAQVLMWYAGVRRYAQHPRGSLPCPPYSPSLFAPACNHHKHPAAVRPSLRAAASSCPVMHMIHSLSSHIKQVCLCPPVCPRLQPPPCTTLLLSGDPSWPQPPAALLYISHCSSFQSVEHVGLSLPVCLRLRHTLLSGHPCWPQPPGCTAPARFLPCYT